VHGLKGARSKVVQVHGKYVPDLRMTFLDNNWYKIPQFTNRECLKMRGDKVHLAKIQDLYLRVVC
jgi:hypothetical protein